MKTIFIIVTASAALFVSVSVVFSDTIGARLLPENGLAAPGYGEVVSIGDDVAVIGAPWSGTGGLRTGAAYLFSRQGDQWLPAGNLLDPDGRPHDYFGTSVALGDDTLVVGAINGDGDAPNSGTAFIFRRNGGQWLPLTELRASDGATNAGFGGCAAISGDVLAVGAYRHSLRATEAGAVYIFEDNGFGWVQSNILTASDASGRAHFGRSVDVDAGLVLVGALPDIGGTDGKAYLFRRGGGYWQELDQFTPPGDAAGGLFGFSVAISNGHAAVGAPGDDGGCPNGGAVYLFRQDGLNWRFSQKITPQEGPCPQHFGRSVAMSGENLVIGADSAGAAYRYQFDGVGWQYVERLVAAVAEGGDRMGWSVAVHAEAGRGHNIIVGAPGDFYLETPPSGAAYLFSTVTGGSGVADIAVSPTTLTFRQRDNRGRTAPDGRSSEQFSDEVSDETCPTGLVIPEDVVAYWRNNKRPPQLNIGGDLPAKVDWSLYDSPVKAQGMCGSCSVFSAVALLENIANQVGLPVGVDFSEQTALSCSEVTCSGGWYWEVFRYVKENGIGPELCLPYAGRDLGCDMKCQDPDYLVTITGFTQKPGMWGEDQTVDDLKLALQEGPLAVSMRVPNDGTFIGNGYKGGIYDYNGGVIPWETNGHAVLLVGYDDATQSFKVKNSWGAGWGESGYFRIAYNDVTDDVRFGSYACRAYGPYLTGKSASFTVTNMGTDLLNISRITSNRSWISLFPTGAFSLSPNGSKVVTVEIEDWSAVPGPIASGDITVFSDDPDESSVTVRVDAEKEPGICPEVHGDIDGIGCVSLTDVVIALQIIAGIDSAGEKIRDDYAASGADVNGDGVPGLAEAIYVLRRLANE